MKQIERLEQLASMIKEIDCNGLKVENALIHITLKHSDFEQLSDEWKNRIDSKLNGCVTNKFGLSFGGIEFSIFKHQTA